ncbi:MAG: hypothetical protein IPJ73_12525 [Zoogloea sp.]|nr:hypothetical protein [Zoogloea sp.]
MPLAHSRFSLPAPLTGWPLAFLLAIYLLVGTTGHLPWRGDDMTHLGPIHAILQGGSWLLPEIAGEIYRGASPLYYWAGALLAQLLGWLLPVHDAARLATTLFCAATLYWTGLAARRLYGEASFAPAILLGMGSLGLVVHAHETQPQLAQLAGMALCFAGLGELSEHPRRAGIQAGLGAALAFLASGLSGLAFTIPVIVLTPLLCARCRSRTALGSIALGLGLTALISALWLSAVAHHAPGEVTLWWQEELASTLPHASHFSEIGKLLQLFGWFAWPLWPIPVLPPLCLLAAFGVSSLRRGAANAFDWFGVMTFIFFGIVVWLGWSALHFGWPPGLARQVARMAPDFQHGAWLAGALIGLTLSLMLVMLPTGHPTLPRRGATNWALGMTLLWCLAVTLWQPWFAHTKNYQPLAAELRQVIGPEADCIKRRNLGDTQRAALDYFASIRTVRYDAAKDCKLLLTYNVGGSTRSVPSEWQPVWERRLGGGRKAETFKLYRRD